MWVRLGDETDRLFRESFYHWGVIRVSAVFEECVEGTTHDETQLEVEFHIYDSSEVIVDGL